MSFRCGRNLRKYKGRRLKSVYFVFGTNSGAVYLASLALRLIISCFLCADTLFIGQMLYCEHAKQLPISLLYNIPLQCEARVCGGGGEVLHFLTWPF